MSSFRKAAKRPVLSRDAGVRQGRAARSAYTILGLEGAKIFLNTHHSGLRGRPLDLAVASDAGLTAVETAIRAEAVRESEGR